MIFAGELNTPLNTPVVDYGDGEDEDDTGTATFDASDDPAIHNSEVARKDAEERYSAPESNHAESTSQQIRASTTGTDPTTANAGNMRFPDQLCSSAVRLEVLSN